MSEIAKAAERPEEIRKITDQDVVDYLEAGRADRNEVDPDARQQVLDHLRARFETLKSTELVPSPAQPLSELLVLSYRVVADWDDLAKDTKIAAERLWRDHFLADKTNRDARERLRGKGRSQGTPNVVEAEVGELRLLCQQSYLLMQLWLEVSLYQMRAFSNFGNRGAVDPKTQENPLQGRISSTVSAYSATLRDWGSELRKVTGLRLFGVQRRDAELLRALSKEFGTARPEEAGWKSLASDAQSELRYQFFDARLQERRRNRHLASAFVYFLYKVTTDFGRSPTRFFATGGVVIVAFAALFFANDYFNPGITSQQHFCSLAGVAGAPWYEIVIHYLYLSVTILTSLGNDDHLAGYCRGTSTQLLLVSAALFGYFLLATLAALLVNKLVEVP